MSPSQLGQSSIFNWNALMGTHLNEQATFTGEPSRNCADAASARLSDAVARRSLTAAGRRTAARGWKIPTILDRPLGVDN